MVLIISNEFDESTNDVIRYLLINKIPFIRLTEENYVRGLNIKLSSNGIYVELKINDKIILLDEVKSFWFRKNDLELFNNERIVSDLAHKHNEIEQFIFKSEIKSLRDFLIFLLEKKNFLGNINKGDGNKLISFYFAKEVGLKIPTTIVSTETSLLKKFSKNKIIKPIEDGFGMSKQGNWLYTKYKLLRERMFENKNENIFPSCIQDYVEKKIELRVFYLDKKCYTMAIFSQLDPKTKIDFRNYNFDKFNRMVPFQLPKNIERKITQFMKKMELNTGSIDLILNKNNEYVFVEVNPVGQYGMIQTHCNINLNYLIYKRLTR